MVLPTIIIADGVSRTVWTAFDCFVHVLFVFGLWVSKVVSVGIQKEDAGRSVAISARFWG